MREGWEESLQARRREQYHGEEDWVSNIVVGGGKDFEGIESSSRRNNEKWTVTRGLNLGFSRAEMMRRRREYRERVQVVVVAAPRVCG